MKGASELRTERWAAAAAAAAAAAYLVLALVFGCSGGDAVPAVAVPDVRAPAERDVGTSEVTPDTASVAVADAATDTRPDGPDAEGCLPPQASCEEGDVCCGRSVCGATSERCEVRCTTDEDCDAAAPACFVSHGCNSARFCDINGPFEGALPRNSRFNVPGDCRAAFCTVRDDGQTYSLIAYLDDDDTPAGVDDLACTESLCEDGQVVIDRPNPLLCDDDNNPLTRERCVLEEGGCVPE